MINFTPVDTTIYLSGFAIHEPVTVFTDFILTAICLFFYSGLNRFENPSVQTTHWKHFFLFFSVSTFAGACSHAFFEIHQGFRYKLFWLTMQALNIVFVYYAQLATLNSVLENSNHKRNWKISYQIQLVVFLIAVFVFQNFGVAMADLGLGFIPIMYFHFMDGKKNKESLWIAYGITIIFLIAFVNIRKLSLHAYFNHLDLAHVLIMINLILMYVGIKRQAISLQAA